MNSNGTELEQVVHTLRTTCHSGWLRGFGELNPSLTPEYLLSLQWIPVLAPIDSLPLRSEYMFTLHQSMAQNLSDM